MPSLAQSQPSPSPGLHPGTPVPSRPVPPANQAQSPFLVRITGRCLWRCRQLGIDGYHTPPHTQVGMERRCSDSSITPAARALAASSSSAPVLSSAAVTPGSPSCHISCEKLGYTWDQTDEQVRVYLAALGGCCPENVQIAFTERSISIVGDVGDKRFFFDVSCTFAALDPVRSDVRFPKHCRHAVLRVVKAAPGEQWDTVRGTMGSR